MNESFNAPKTHDIDNKIVDTIPNYNYANNINNDKNEKSSSGDDKRDNNDSNKSNEDDSKNPPQNNSNNNNNNSENNNNRGKDDSNSNKKDSDDDRNNNKDNSNSNDENNSGSDRSCCSCKKLKTKKKGKNKTRVRKLPSKFNNLKFSQKELIKNEFKLDIDFNLAEQKFRLCYDCFKKLLNRLNELDSSPEMNESRDETDSDKNKNHAETNSSSKVIELSDDDYYDYDEDDDENDNENADDSNDSDDSDDENNDNHKPKSGVSASENSKNKEKEEGQARNDQGFNELGDSNENCITDSQFQKISNDKNNNHLLNEYMSEKTSSTGESLANYFPKSSSEIPSSNQRQIADVINDAIKNALQTKISPISGLSSSGTNKPSEKDIQAYSASALFSGSITKGTPFNPSDSQLSKHFGLFLSLI